ncbi:MAG: hypothetical protein IJN54_09380 [Lachnospiraceae bacterium]|nr:hypothetical protein [Lachnospiraceae bacterium]
MGTYQYTMVQWIFFFYFYCFFGWIFESTYVSLKKKHFINRGFMRGPFLPLYGSGAIMMLIVSAPFQDNLILVYIAGCIGATALEYVTGVVMEELFKVRYWDYSKLPFNFQGHICLSSTLAWGGLTLLMTQFLHKLVEQLVLSVTKELLIPVTFFITLTVVVDFSLSFKAAMDIRDILVKMEKAKQEVEHMSKRLDVLIAIVNNDVENWKQEKEEKLESLKFGMEERFERIKETVSEKHSDYFEEIKEEIAELREKYHINLEVTKQMKSFKDFYKRGMLKGNPMMVSGKFKEVLEELKEAVEEKKNKKK